MKYDAYFRILNIEPTKDKRTIKTAYRALLRKTNPEDDAEGFKQLREAYEKACEYAGQKEEEKSVAKADSPVVDFIARCEQLYDRFPDRILVKSWEKLAREMKNFDLDMEEEVRMNFFVFLMEHFHFPWDVWKLFDKTFHISESRKELLEHFPEDFVEYLMQVVRYDSFVNYDLFEGPEHGDYDRYIEGYQRLRQYTDLGRKEEAYRELARLKKEEVYHPYTEVEEARLLLFEEKSEEAGEILRRLGENYDREERILCCLAQYQGMQGNWEEAEKIYDRILTFCPQSESAKTGKAEALTQKGDYRQAREDILDLLEESPQDERLMQALTDANVYLINELLPDYEKGVLPQNSCIDLAWAYYQNMHFEDGIRVLDSFEPDEEHRLDYNNVKGRIYLSMDKNKEALVYLEPWLSELLTIEDDGTKKTKRRLARLGYAWYTVGAAKAAIILEEKKGNLSEAWGYFEHAIKEEKEEGQIISYYHTMADIRRQKKEYTKVLECCEKILAMNPQYYPAILLRQDACLNLGMYQEVLDDFGRAVSLYPYYGKPYATLMKMYFLFGEYDKAGEVLQQAGERKVKGDSLTLLEARLMAVTAKSEEPLEKALAMLDEMKASGWTNESDLDREEWQEVHFRRGLILTDLGRLLEAEEAFLEVLKEKEDSFVWYSYAVLLMKMENYEKAAQYFEKTSAVMPKDPAVSLRLGLCLKQLGQYERALQYLEEAIAGRKNENTPLSYNNLAECYKILGRMEEAFFCCRENILRFQNDVDSYLLLGEIYREKEEYEEALKLYQLGEEKTGNKGFFRPEILRTLGEAGKKEEFEAWAFQCLEEDAQNPVMLQLVGETFLYGFREIENAEKCIEKAIILSEKDTELFRESWYLYGRCLLAAGDREAAGEAFRRYLTSCEKAGKPVKQEKSYENQSRQHFREGCAWWFLGEYEKAEECFSQMKEEGCRCAGCTASCCYERLMGEALIFYAEGEKEKAIALYEKARKVVPNDLEHRFELEYLTQN